jgi:tetratricopeptide (TPR) repeat protein
MMEYKMESEDKQLDNRSRQSKPVSITLGRTQLMGALGVVALLVLGLMYRSNGQSDVDSASNVETTTSVQKSLLQIAEEALAVNPQDSVAWYTKGVYLQSSIGDNQGAVDSYSRAIEINPGYFSALFNRGLALRSLGRLEKAKADFARIVELKAGVAPQSLYNLGLIAIDQGDTALGDEYLQKAYEQDPSLQP